MYLYRRFKVAIFDLNYLILLFGNVVFLHRGWVDVKLIWNFIGCQRPKVEIFWRMEVKN